MKWWSNLSLLTKEYIITGVGLACVAGLAFLCMCVVVYGGNR